MEQHIDKNWILKDRDTLDYEIGVEKFLMYAEEHCENPKSIPCPCGRCVNFKKFSVKIVRGHIYENGFSHGYVEWIWHGENSSRTSRPSSKCPSTDPEFKATCETLGVCEAAYKSGDYDNDSEDFRMFVADAEKPLFEGSESTKLETSVSYM